MKRTLPRLLLFFFFSIFIIGCKKEPEKQTTWISGQIINPHMDYIIISKGDMVIDSLPLDAMKHFSFHSDQLEEGIYMIRHLETQMFYLMPGDSLVLHLNTQDFDESLNYSGRGASKNNLLMDLFLTNENENKIIPQWYSLSPKDFTKKIDSLRNKKQKEIQAYFFKNPVTDGFKNIAQASVDYDYYLKKEAYGRVNDARLNLQNTDFYSYRKKINYGNKELGLYYPYYWFFIRYFDNLAFDKFPPGENRNSFDFNYEKLKIIDSLITEESFKNSLAAHTAKRYFFHAKEEENQKKFFALFNKINTNPADKEEIEHLFSTSINMSRGRKLPEVSLVSMDNSTLSIHEIIKEPTVLYFWNMNWPQQISNIHERVKELKTKYPEIDFIGINTNDHYRRWRNFVRAEDFDDSKEYQLEDLEQGKSLWVLTNMNKTIILHQDGTIFDGTNNIFNQDFEETLIGFLNH